ncbi:SURF1 family protein [Rhizobium paknamense]|uniref:SURF1-like protein n=1 Tax=Rhizobium paknamense TaxID=1206817 RepID=A0ABU0IA50_9HYPH|nr:SURF1 family protein [Rhizobium paknamense]MDQ0455096.1 surfeit locus 1 family protein [Rhizobium paknamense]
MRRFKLAFTIVLTLAAIAVLIGLGNWQMHRLAWKESLLAAIEERRHQPPETSEEIAAEVGSGAEIDYKAMTATGTFLNDKERHFLATRDGVPGYHVYTPLQLSDGTFLFVNRGFVPAEKKDPATRMGGQLLGEQRITGLARARLAGRPSSLVPDNDPVKNIFYWKDLDAMAASTGLPQEKVLPFFLDAGPEPVPGGLPVGGVTEIDLPNNHLQYALTWYGLAATLAVVSGLAFLRRKR